MIDENNKGDGSLKSYFQCYTPKNTLITGSGCGSVGRVSLPILEIRGSNPVIGKHLFISNILFTVNCVLKRRK